MIFRCALVLSFGSWLARLLRDISDIAIACSILCMENQKILEILMTFQEG